MPETVTERERFACIRVYEVVTITRTLRVRRDARGEILSQTTIHLDCDARGLCSVSHGRGESDWSRCAHPELARIR